VQIDLDAYREQSRENWGQMAQGWEDRREWMMDITGRVNEWLAEKADPQPGQTILDIAAGTGDLGLRVAERVGDEGHVISTDFAPEMVDVARRQGEARGLTNVEYRVLDAESMDLDDDSVDGVVCRWGYMLMADPAAARGAISHLRALAGQLGLAQADIVVQEQVSIGAELILGVSGDPTFGPVLTVGIGGIAAEVEPDIQILLPTLSRSEVLDAVGRLRSKKLLDGFRGAAAVSLPDLADAVGHFADMVRALSPWVSEIDVNPLIADRQGGLVAVDALMVLRGDSEEA